MGTRAKKKSFFSNLFWLLRHRKEEKLQEFEEDRRASEAGVGEGGGPKNGNLGKKSGSCMSGNFMNAGWRGDMSSIPRLFIAQCLRQEGRRRRRRRRRSRRRDSARLKEKANEEKERKRKGLITSFSHSTKGFPQFAFFKSPFQFNQVGH